MNTQQQIQLQKKVTRISNLIVAYIKAEITETQTKMLMKWVNASDHNKKCFDQLCDPDYLQKALNESKEVDSESIWKKTINKIESLQNG